MKLNRKVVTVIRGKQEQDDQYVSLSPRERLSFVWELTKEIFSIAGGYDVESGLQRDVIHIIRGKS
ncbi:MAG: hypothetical protein GY754_42235 [bacterium]|nr:hypothetical protein [bacterium]